MNGRVMNISRLRMGSDGDGVTTLVQMYGCPLKCEYCANKFEKARRNSLYEMRADYYEYTAEELADVLKKDEIYYLMSGGGVVFGGGEPLLQSEFIAEVCKNIPTQWNIRVETSLNVPWKSIKPLVEIVDEWIVDIKDMNPEIYKSYTGRSGQKAYENLGHLIGNIGKENVRVRMPCIPCFNKQEDIDASMKMIKDKYGISPEVFDYIIF